MREDARARFAQLERLCAPEVNRTLLQSLRSRARQGEATREMEFVAANLARRAGDLDSARRAFEAYLGAPLQPGVAVPPGLSSGGGFNISPIVAIDGFLPPAEMEALHRHACAIEDRFRVANVNSIAPQRAPDKRDTYITYDFDHLKSFFSDHVAENLPRLCAALGIPDFEVDRTEIKMTCYLDGGFFKTHADNHGSFADAGRAVTWLYYFGDRQPLYRGGELYLFDTDFDERGNCGAWLTRIEPRPNRFVAFPSWFLHAVAPTALPCGTFARGRFAIGGHVRKTADPSAAAWWE